MGSNVMWLLGCHVIRSLLVKLVTRRGLFGSTHWKDICIKLALRQSCAGEGDIPDSVEPKRKKGVMLQSEKGV
jgi:hypothetical protein